MLKNSKIATHSVFLKPFIFLFEFVAKMSESSTKNVTKEEVLALEASRKSKEEELTAWMGVLDSQGVGMNDALVDNEDYPSKEPRSNG